VEQGAIILHVLGTFAGVEVVRPTNGLGARRWRSARRLLAPGSSDETGPPRQCAVGDRSPSRTMRTSSPSPLVSRLGKYPFKASTGCKIDRLRQSPAKTRADRRSQAYVIWESCPGTTTDTGEAVDGTRGAFADPDGYVWEVAHNPGWTINPDGSITI
jgi:hypothetical protein